MGNAQITENDNLASTNDPSKSESNIFPQIAEGFNGASANYGTDILRETSPQTVETQKIYAGIVQSLCSITEIRDQYTAIHQHRVAHLALEISKSIGLRDDQIVGTYVATSIHDIGKLSVPSEILYKPGKLSDIEFGLIKTHPQISYEILKWIDFPWPIAQITLEHHERINGSGYPSGLKANNILIEAKILAVADVIEAMASDRPYRKAPGLNKALEEITINKGNLYDAEVVDATLKLFSSQRFYW